MSPGVILQVEDDPNDVFFLKYAFKQAEIANPVQVARDAKEAIDYLTLSCQKEHQADHPVPWLVLLDLKLPHTSGMEVLQWIRAHPTLTVTPVVIFSSSAHRDDIFQAYKNGANSFLVKPSSTEDLVRLAKLIKEYWLTVNHPPAVQ